MNNNPTVLILAAGKCTRFWPLYNKSFTPFLGKPLLVHQIEKLKKTGFNNICVVVNEENEDFVKSLGIKCILQSGEGQGAAILSAEKGINGPLLIMNADDLFSDELLLKATDLIEKENPEAFLTAVAVKEYFPGGYLIVNENLVKSVVEKPGENNLSSHLFRLVLDYFKDSKMLLEFLQSGKGYEEVINDLIQNGVKINCLTYDGKWASLKYAWHVLDVMNLFLDNIKESKISPSALIDKTAIIQGNVIIEDGVKVFENAKIVGPCYLGKNAVIGNNVILRGSMVGEGSVLGFSTDVARSYLGKNCWFHSNYLGDSVLGNNISLGAGANLANLRLDEEKIYSIVSEDKINTQKDKFGSIIGDNVRIGINASIMPGVKIGNGTFIGSGVLLESDVLENKFVCEKTELIVKDNIKQILGDREEFKNKIQK